MCQEISGCRKLRKLGLSHAENITPIGLQSLAKLTHLEKLLLYHANNISSKDFRDFFTSAKLTKITYVNLSGCKNINVSVEAIVRKSCPRVRRVIVGRRPIRLEEAYIDFGLYQKDNVSRHDKLHFVSVQPLNHQNGQRLVASIQHVQQNAQLAQHVQQHVQQAAG